MREQFGDDRPLLFAAEPSVSFALETVAFPEFAADERDEREREKASLRSPVCSSSPTAMKRSGNVNADAKTEAKKGDDELLSPSFGHLCRPSSSLSERLAVKIPLANAPSDLLHSSLHQCSEERVDVVVDRAVAERERATEAKLLQLSKERKRNSGRNSLRKSTREESDKRTEKEKEKEKATRGEGDQSPTEKRRRRLFANNDLLSSPSLSPSSSLFSESAASPLLFARRRWSRGERADAASRSFFRTGNECLRREGHSEALFSRVNDIKTAFLVGEIVEDTVLFT